MLNIFLIIILLIFVTLMYTRIMMFKQKRKRKNRNIDHYNRLVNMQEKLLEVPLYQQMNINVESLNIENLEDLDLKKFEVYSPSDRTELECVNNYLEWEKFFANIEVPFTIFISENRPYWIIQRDILALYPNIKKEFRKYSICQHSEVVY